LSAFDRAIRRGMTPPARSPFVLEVSVSDSRQNAFNAARAKRATPAIAGVLQHGPDRSPNS
jgi:hypothetical protein